MEGMFEISSELPQSLLSLQNELQHEGMQQIVQRLVKFPIEKLSRTPIESYRGYVADSLQKYLHKHPKDKAIANSVVRSIFGIVDPQTSLAQKEARSLDDIVTSATSEQALAAELFCAGDIAQENSDIVKYVYAKARLYEALAGVRSTSPEQAKFRAWWAGVRTQYALMNYFKEQDYSVYAPSTRQQIFACDVNSGVDFVARSNDPLDTIALGIDAKSKNPNQRVLVTEVNDQLKRNDGHFLDPQLGRWMRQLDNKNGMNDIYIAEIRLLPDEITRLDLTLPHTVALARMGELSTRTKVAIQQGFRSKLYAYA